VLYLEATLINYTCKWKTNLTINVL